MSDPENTERSKDRLTHYQTMACRAARGWSLYITYYAAIFILIVMATHHDHGDASTILTEILQDPAIWGIAIMPPLFMMFMRWSAMDLATQLHNLDSDQTPLEQTLFATADSFSEPALSNESFELNSLLVEVVEKRGSIMREKNVQVSLEVHEDIPNHLAGQPQILKTVLGELFDSAVDRTSKGCIYISAKVLEKLHGTLLLRFEVGDSGAGDHISEARLQQCQQLLSPVDGQINEQNKKSPGQTVWFTMTLQKEHKKIAAA